MKNKYILLQCLVLLVISTGCVSKAPASYTEEADDGQIVDNLPPKLLNASDVTINTSYDFAYSDEVNPDIDTYSNGGDLFIESVDDVEIDVYGLNTGEDGEEVDGVDFIQHMSLKANESQKVEKKYSLYHLEANQKANIKVIVK